MKRNPLRRSPLQSPVNSPEFIRTFVFDRAPTSSDYRNFKVTDLWIHRNPGGVPEYGYYVLSNKPKKSGFWIKLGSKQEGPIDVVNADEGIPVIPDINGEISIIGGVDGVTTSGTSSTLSINVDCAKGDIEALIPNIGDPVTASGGNINLIGENGVTTSGSGNTLTINVEGGEGDIISLTPDVGDPVTASGGNIDVFGGDRVTTVGTLNTLTINSNITDISWTEVTGLTQNMEVNNGYISSNSSLVTLTLPVSSTIGDVLKIDGKGAGGWLIAQNASQTIHFLNFDTTIGTSGSLASTNRYANVTCRCITDNNEWTVESVVGNLVVV